MGTKERREREKDQIRTAILDAARELFVAQGYEGVSMRAIAEKIEYSPTIIYNYFRDKEALISELCQSDFGRLAEQRFGGAGGSDRRAGSRELAEHRRRGGVERARAGRFRHGLGGRGGGRLGIGRGRVGLGGRVAEAEIGGGLPAGAAADRVDDAPHVIMTDHSIQRRAPANALAEFPERPAEEYRGPVVPYYPAPFANTPRNDLYRAVAQV